MQKTLLQREEIKLVGITTRTNNRAELDPKIGKILPCIQTYFHQNIAARISHRLHPGTTYCAYTEYASDHNGDYTYFIGEAVDSLTDIPDDLKTLVIPAQTYVKFTTGPGSMPDIIRKPWQQIWQMSPHELGGKRSYHTDFEIYDERAIDHQNIILDIYIGINPS